jgi:hypothetical protein
MRGAIIGAAAAALLGGCASTQVAAVETGHPRGSLGVAAIDRGDFVGAERLLTQGPHADSEHPARLINLGYVYLQTDRNEEAARVLRQALAQPRPRDLVTIDGREIDSHSLARELLARAQVRLAAR